LEVVQCLADKCPDALLIKNIDGYLPVHLAAQRASLVVVQYLADMCPDALLVKDSSGRHPLPVAVAYKVLEAFQCLTNKQPNALLVKDGDGRLLLHIAAAQHASLAMFQCLADKCPDACSPRTQMGGFHCTLLHSTHRWRWSNALQTSAPVQCLADKCPDALLAKNKEGFLPLHIASQHSCLDVVHLLVVNFPLALLFKTSKG
jgi:ankyrin repeat protein